MFTRKQIAAFVAAVAVFVYVILPVVEFLARA